MDSCSDLIILKFLFSVRADQVTFSYTVFFFSFSFFFFFTDLKIICVALGFGGLFGFVRIFVLFCAHN